MRTIGAYLIGIITACFCFLTAAADAPNLILKEPVTLHCESAPLRDVLSTLSKQLPISFVYRDPLVKDILVSYEIKNGLLENVLTYLLPEHRLSYQLLDNGLIVLLPKSTTKSEDVTQQHFQSPKVIRKTEPVYPPKAIQQNATGLVCLALRINNRGEVDSIRLRSSSGFVVLDSAAADYASSLQFSPALSNNKPVPIWMEWEFEYIFSDMAGSTKMLAH